MRWKGLLLSPAGERESAVDLFCGLGCVPETLLVYIIGSMAAAHGREDRNQAGCGPILAWVAAAAIA